MNIFHKMEPDNSSNHSDFFTKTPSSSPDENYHHLQQQQQQPQPQPAHSPQQSDNYGAYSDLTMFPQYRTPPMASNLNGGGGNFDYLNFAAAGAQNAASYLNYGKL